MNKRPEIGCGNGNTVEFLPEKILDSFYVMIRFCLERLHAAGILQAETVHKLIQDILYGSVERTEFGEIGFVREMLQPANLDERAIADQRVLGQVLA